MWSVIVESLIVAYRLYDCVLGILFSPFFQVKAPKCEEPIDSVEITTACCLFMPISAGAPRARYLFNLSRCLPAGDSCQKPNCLIWGRAIPRVRQALWLEESKAFRLGPKVCFICRLKGLLWAKWQPLVFSCRLPYCGWMARWARWSEVEPHTCDRASCEASWYHT